MIKGPLSFTTCVGKSARDLKDAGSNETNFTHIEFLSSLLHLCFAERIITKTGQVGPRASVIYFGLWKAARSHSLTRSGGGISYEQARPQGP
jgi:hypothetical protein